jgi:pimeloyl-ACP methyl ester carboxylesterase
MESLVDAWPVTVTRLTLVGHSMGGLVIRAACHRADVAGSAWARVVRDVVTLGTPHHGAPLAKALHAVDWALRLAPESRTFADALRTSAGIRDLRYGTVEEIDWRQEEYWGFSDRRSATPLLPHCKYTFVTAAVTADPKHRVGLIVGDLLVRTESAGGRSRTRSIPVPPESVVDLGGMTHFDLLHHVRVYDVVRDALR